MGTQNHHCHSNRQDKQHYNLYTMLVSLTTSKVEMHEDRQVTERVQNENNSRHEHRRGRLNDAPN